MTEVERQKMVHVSDDLSMDRGLGPFEGKWYSVFTPAPIYHGRLLAVTPTDYHLEEASWIPDTGRLNEYIKNPNKVAIEAEYIGSVIIPRGSVLALCLTADGKVDTR